MKIEMTLQDLQKLFPDATESTWHQHPNGGGWVENTASVEFSAYVGPWAVVYGNARVFRYALVSGNARVRGRNGVYLTENPLTAPYTAKCKCGITHKFFKWISCQYSCKKCKQPLKFVPCG